MKNIRHMRWDTIPTNVNTLYLNFYFSCADTMVTTGEDDAALHSCADTLAESDDEIDQFRDSPTPPLGSGEKMF